MLQIISPVPYCGRFIKTYLREVESFVKLFRSPLRDVPIKGKNTVLYNKCFNVIL